jgi:tetratricopeptide (TPR) repeat protein
MEKLEEQAQKYMTWGVSLGTLWLCTAVGTIFWCWHLGGGNLERASLAFALCAASFGVGSSLGFMFSIFGDEQEPFGKIREAMIALASGLTGVGLAKATSLGALLGQIHIFANDSDRNTPFSILVAISYSIAGFFFMYFFRKLAINPALAEAREATERFQNTSEVSLVATKVMEKLSPSILLGREFIDDSESGELPSDETKQLHDDLFAPDVEHFLDACDDDANKGRTIEHESVSVAARLRYYRIYFLKKGSELRIAEEQKAGDWIYRALMRDPTNPDLQIKLADLLAMQDRDDEAVSILERLERDEDSPQYVQQWLGYYLLFLDGRENDAIRHSLEFHARFPDESSGLFNAACGYAQLYSIELEEANATEIPDSANRLECLRLLREAIRKDRSIGAFAIRNSEAGESLEALHSDAEFIKLTTTMTKPERRA